MEQLWKHYKSIWKETCTEIFERKTRQHKEWILAKIPARKDRKATVNNSRTRAAEAQAQRMYNKVNKDMKRTVKGDKKSFVENPAE